MLLIIKKKQSKSYVVVENWRKRIIYDWRSVRFSETIIIELNFDCLTEFKCSDKRMYFLVIK